ncbi:MAG: hypothetical protein HYY22_07665 [Thaumarchaeota archaeon]|nr:hypothetical protein [Nitrososphaerota archaeon]
MSLRTFPLLVLITATWLLIFVGSYVIFKIIVPLPEIYPGFLGQILTEIIKVALSGVMTFLWLYAMWKLRNFYVHRRLLSRSEDE